MAKVTPAWLSEGFTSALTGVNSAVAPDLVGTSALAWGYNVANRGSRPHTRPYFIRRMTLPSGRVQGASYFGVQGGMGVVVIDGRMYRLRPGSSAKFRKCRRTGSGGVADTAAAGDSCFLICWSGCWDFSCFS